MSFFKRKTGGTKRVLEQSNDDEQEQPVAKRVTRSSARSNVNSEEPEIVASLPKTKRSLSRTDENLETIVDDKPAAKRTNHSLVRLDENSAAPRDNSTVDLTENANLIRDDGGGKAHFRKTRNNHPNRVEVQ